MSQQSALADSNPEESGNIQLTLVGATMPTSLSDILEEVVDVS